MYRNKVKTDDSKDSSLLEGEERHYFKKMKDILEDFPNKGPPSVPSQLLPHLYIGSLRNAEDLNMLERLNISHVLNVAGTRTFDLTKSPYPKEVGIKEYLMIPAEDHDSYNIVQHFFEANAFINRAKRIGGKALVHCNLGVNRCGALCAAYLLIEERLPLLEVVTFLKRKRAVVLCNRGFRLQLLRYALARGLIEGADNGNRYGSLGTISKYLVNRPTLRPEVERQRERMKQSESARRREQERLSEKGREKNKTTNSNHITNGVTNGNGNGQKNENGHTNGNGEKPGDGNEQLDSKVNGNNNSTAVNGDVSEEDEEVASLVNQSRKPSRFLSNNSTIYSPEPQQEESQSYSPTKQYGRKIGDRGSSSSRPYTPTMEFGTYFGTKTKPYQRSYSADIESLNNRCTSPDYDDEGEDDDVSAKFRSRRRRGYEEQRPVTVCGDSTRVNTRQFQYNRYGTTAKPFNVDDSDDDLDSEYAPMINMFHLEHLSPKKNVCSNTSTDLFQPMCFSCSEPNLLEKNAKLKNYVHVRPYAPSLEFVGRKTVSSGSSYSSGHYSHRRYSSSQIRPHSVYTDRPYSSSSVPSSSSDRPLSSYKSTSYKGYSPEILPTYNLPSSTYSGYSSSSSYRRGPISSVLMRSSKSSFSEYPRCYSSMY